MRRTTTAIENEMWDNDRNCKNQTTCLKIMGRTVIYFENIQMSSVKIGFPLRMSSLQSKNDATFFNSPQINNHNSMELQLQFMICFLSCAQFQVSSVIFALKFLLSRPFLSTLTHCRLTWFFIPMFTFNATILTFVKFQMKWFLLVLCHVHLATINRNFASISQSMWQFDMRRNVRTFFF